MTDRELMQMALEALDSKHDMTKAEWRVLQYHAFTALREALAQPEQDDGYCQSCEGNYCTAKDGCVARDNPPQREWQGLTDKDIDDIARDDCFLFIDLCRNIEAKLKDKNT